MPGKVILFRGLPGSGKTTAATAAAANTVEVKRHTVCVCADDFFTDSEGNYKYDAARVPDAHAWCQQQVCSALSRSATVFVHNTFVKKWEVQNYHGLANRYRASVEVVDLFDAGLTDDELASRCVHNVPIEIITRMRKTYEQ
jgi:predicted kinase